MSDLSYKKPTESGVLGAVNLSVSGAASPARVSAFRTDGAPRGEVGIPIHRKHSRTLPGAHIDEASGEKMNAFSFVNVQRPKKHPLFINACKQPFFRGPESLRAKRRVDR